MTALMYQVIKSLIRKTQAKSVALYFGLLDEHISNLELSFYETGNVKKYPVGAIDIQHIKEFIQRVKFHQIHAAGDSKDTPIV